jgi:hypothetical protein
VLAAGLASEWMAGTGVQVANMPTLYGSLSFSLKAPDAHTLQFKIEGGVKAKIILRPPLAGPLRSVSMDGSAWTDFDEHSVTIISTPAEIICRT